MLIIDKLSYQSRWCQSDPRRKFWLYLILLVVALTGSPLVQIFELAGTAVLTCHLLQISVQRYLRWLAIPLFFIGRFAGHSDFIYYRASKNVVFCADRRSCHRY